MPSPPWFGLSWNPLVPASIPGMALLPRRIAPATQRLRRTAGRSGVVLRSPAESRVRRRFFRQRSLHCFFRDSDSAGDGVLKLVNFIQVDAAGFGARPARRSAPGARRVHAVERDEKQKQIFRRLFSEQDLAVTEPAEEFGEGGALAVHEDSDAIEREANQMTTQMLRTMSASEMASCDQG